MKRTSHTRRDRKLVACLAVVALSWPAGAPLAAGLDNDRDYPIWNARQRVNVFQRMARAIDDHRNVGQGTQDHNYYYAVSEDDSVWGQQHPRYLLFLIERAHIIGCPHGSPSHAVIPGTEYGAMWHFLEGDYRKLFQDAEYVLPRMVNHPRMLQLIAMAAQRDPQFIDATREYFDSALALYPEYAITHYQYGAFLLDLGHTDGAIVRLRDAVAKDPRFIAAWVALGRAHRIKGDETAAKEAEDRARALGWTGSPASTANEPDEDLET